MAKISPHKILCLHVSRQSAIPRKGPGVIIGAFLFPRTESVASKGPGSRDNRRLRASGASQSSPESLCLTVRSSGPQWCVACLERGRIPCWFPVRSDVAEVEELKRIDYKLPFKVIMRRLRVSASVHYGSPSLGNLCAPILGVANL